MVLLDFRAARASPGEKRKLEAVLVCISVDIDGPNPEKFDPQHYIVS